MADQQTSPATSSSEARAGAGPVAKALAGLAALAIAMGIGRFAFTPILPMMLQDAGLSIASGGLLASANYLGYLLGALSAVAIRLRPEHAIRANLLVIAAVTLAMAWPLPFAAWLALRLVAGVASGGEALQPLRRDRRVGWWMDDDSFAERLKRANDR